MTWYTSFICFILFLMNLSDAEPTTRCLHIQHEINIRDQQEPPLNLTCSTRNNICQRNYNISYIDIPPYSKMKIIEEKLLACCGKCASYKHLHMFKNISELNRSSVRGSDFIYPVLGNEKKATRYGYHFIPTFTAPSLVYVTLTPAPLFERMMSSMGAVFPLVIICLLMTIVSGFITWLLETWCNKEEFPRPFLIGWFEGFWWSFISMTTVGYGDKTPRSIPGRLFAVVWILIGITLFGILTGLLTSIIQGSETPPEPKMNNAKVGVPRYRTLEISMVAKAGGSVIQTNGMSFESDVNSLVELLRHKKIDGLLFDEMTYHYLLITYHQDWIGSKELTKENWNFLHDNTVRTSKTYPGEKLSYGILAKEYEVYLYFRDAFIDNHILYEAGMVLEMTKTISHKKDNYGLFDISNHSYMYAAIGLVAISVSFLLMGIVLEVSRKRCLKCGADTTVGRVNEGSSTMS